MGGRLATGLERISHNLDDLREPGFWAVIGTFESEWTLAKFSNVVESDLPLSAEAWQGVASHEWKSSHDRDLYHKYVNQIREKIADGDVYQVNACRILNVDNSKNPSLAQLARGIVESNPAPFASYIHLPDLEIASASPERFISLRDGVITSSPIKGTSATSDFQEKDHSENLMIVDLIRNDVGMIAETGSVTTPRLLATEEHPGLFHLVSDIQARVAPGKDVVEVLRSMMPPGSVSGAPKHSALKIIQEWEGKRGPYCGALGWVENGNADLAVGIRTFWQGSDRILHFGTGAGITWGSDPELEWEETELKARRLIGIASKNSPSISAKMAQ